MLSTAIPWDRVAEGYTQTTMKYFRCYAEKALEIACVNEQSDILDVACGPGTLPLLAAHKVKSVTAVDFSELMLEQFKKALNEHSANNIQIHCCDGQALPFSDEQFDAAFSMFGLMFFPDRAKGYAEIFRTLRPGGKVVISSWAPVADSPAMQTMFGAIKTINPDMSEPQTEIESLENPAFFKSELQAAGFKHVEIHSVVGEYPINDVATFWSDIVRGSAPIVMMKQAMSSDEWQKKERHALAYLSERLSTLPTVLTARAWLGYGLK